MRTRTVEQRLAALEQGLNSYRARLPVSTTAVARDGLAAGALALALLEDFYSHQVAEGAIDVGAARRAIRQGAVAAARTRPALGEAIEALARQILDRLDREEADRFD